MTKREKLSMIPPVVIMLTSAFLAPSPRRRMVDGEEVAEFVIKGFVVPPWLFMGVIGIIFFTIWRVCFVLSKKFWPYDEAEARQTDFGRALESQATKADEVRTVDVENVFPRAGGGFIAWEPDEPGTRSPMDYYPPVFTVETTAREFLETEPPNSMRVLMIGDDWYDENSRHHQLVCAWLRNAPEETLKEMIPEAERQLQGYEEPEDPEECHSEMLSGLSLAKKLRGIPTKRDLLDLAERMNMPNIGSYWRDHEE